MAIAFATVPVLLWAYATGPLPGKAGVPGESTCSEAGCHVGTAVNGGPGSVRVTFPNGLTYSPGVKQHLVVTISDPNARNWGFQLAAREAANTRTQAGVFTSTDRTTGVVCGASAGDPNPVYIDFGATQTCPSTRPFTYIEHTLNGSSRLSSGSGTYEFDWTPPASAVGTINIYVAGNAANANGQETGDRIYTANYALTPAASGNTPTISASGVISGASFAPGVAPNSWIAIQGANLSTTTDTWDRAITNGNLPTSLNNVSVTIGGKPAYVYFVSPTQINVLAPDIGTGSMSVTVKNGDATSESATTTSQTYMPAFFLWAGKYAVATRQDFSWAVPNGTFAGVTTVPAKPGDVIILWGTGFGPTNPATPIGVQVPQSLFSTASPVSVTVGGINATVFGAALAPGFAGLYQVAIQVPDSAPDGDLPVVATISGASSPVSTLLTVKR